MKTQINFIAKSIIIIFLFKLFSGATTASVEVVDVKFNLYNYEASVTFSSPVDATNAIYNNFELRNYPVNWDNHNFSTYFEDKRKADAEGKIWVFKMKNRSAEGLPGTSYEGGALYFRIGLNDDAASLSGIRDVRDNSLLPRYNIIIPANKIYYDENGGSSGGEDYKGWENHFVPRRLEVNSITISQGTFTRPAAFESWRSVHWVKPNAGATSLNVSVNVANDLSVVFRQDGVKKMNVSNYNEGIAGQARNDNNNTFNASFGLNNGKKMTEIEVIVSDGESERSYYLDVCATDPQAHDVVAEYYGLLPYPKSERATQVLVDQITGGYNLTPQRINFIANYLTGSQKNYKELINPVKAINPNWHSLHYHLAIWNGDADIIINNAWSKAEWLYLTNELFKKDPHIFMYAVNKNTKETTWVRDFAFGANLMNISNETYYQFLLENLVSQCTSTGYESIFFDSFALGTVYSFSNYTFINLGGGSNVPDEFTKYQNPQLGGLTWLQASEEYISRMNKDLNKRGIWLLPNLGNMQTSWDPLDYALPNGGMLEAVPMRPDNNVSMDDRLYLYDWLQSMSRTMYLTQKDRVIILQPYLDDINNLDYRLFVIGEYLMVKGDYTFLNSCMAGQSQASWYPEYEINLGAPTQTHVIPDVLFTPWKESIDKAILNYKEGNLFVRRFEKGIVIINPHRTAQQYKLSADKSCKMAVISGGGTVPESGIGDLKYSLKWADVTKGETKTIPATGALILRYDEDEPDPTPEMDSKLIAVSVNGIEYKNGDTPIKLITDQVFTFIVTVKNTGTETWGQFYDKGERGATFFSLNPNYNENFGTFFLSPGQGVTVRPGETHTYNLSLRAPNKPGDCTMAWRLADWIIPYIFNSELEDYRKRPFYGDSVIVKLSVSQRTGQPPVPSRKPGVVDALDFVYEGSFSLPSVPIPDGTHTDEKAFFESGITLRTINGEKRLILATGTYRQSLYEVAIPVPGKFVGNDYSAVPIADLRTVFGGLPKFVDGDVDNGSIWYDESSGILYWTNYHFYYTNPSIHFPILRSARLDGGKLTEVQQWFQPEDTGGAPLKSFWGGVTGIPDSFAEKYTGGRKLALGFGGIYSINSGASWGPSFAAVSPKTGGTMDLLPVIYSSINNRTIRDGNYFYSYIDSDNPQSPWYAPWCSNDIIRSGVFIDLPDKKGFVSFSRQGIGRIGYDYGGMNWNGKTQNTWYFYDFETLGKAAKGEISKVSVTPSSYSVMDYPHDLTKNIQYTAGSCFDPETRRLYLYTMLALSREDTYKNPVVHVYSVKDDNQTLINAANNTLKAMTMNGLLHVTGLTAGQVWSIYTIAGQLVHSSIATGNEANVKLPVHGIYIVKSSNEMVKVIF